MNISSEDPNQKQIINYLKSFEARISRIEAYLKLTPAEEELAEEKELEKTREVTETADALEFQIGQFWFAKVGIVILAIGIAFLLTFPYQNLPPALPSLFGYILVGGLIILSHLWRNTFTYISRYLLGGALVLLYFTTLRLHFFSAPPVVTGRFLEVILLLLVVGINLVVAARRRSIYLSGLTFIMGYITAVVSEQPYALFSIATVMAALVVFFKLKFQWPQLLIFGILITYFTHLLWFLNNPFMGNTLQLVEAPPTNIIFILIYALIFAVGILLRGKDKPEDNLLIISTFFNSVGAFTLFLLLTLTKFQAHFTLYHLLASLLFLGLSIIFWIREQSKFSTFFYAMMGYAALSVTIISFFGKPDFFTWLCWQSLLVISTAIWFRSKIIIVANFVIYLLIFIASLAMAGKVAAANLSFAIVALLSARIMNWQKHRLDLRTELMRNAYLITAFFIFPYGLYHLVPGAYVVLAWIGVALLYYILSRILSNKKYRWMALGTLLLTVFYVLIVGIIQLEPAYRMASFLILGIVLLIVSLVYSRMRARASANETEEGNPS